MFWLLLIALALLFLYLRGFQLMVLLVIAVVMSLLLIALSFVMGGFLRFLYDAEAVRSWTLPRFGLDHLFSGDNLLYALSLFPVVMLLDLLRGIGDILWHHPHPIMWSVMAIGCWPVALMWRNAGAALAARCGSRG